MDKLSKVMKKGNSEIGSPDIPLPDPIFSVKPEHKNKPHEIKLDEESVPDKIPSIDEEPKPGKASGAEKVQQRQFIEFDEDLNNVVSKVLDNKEPDSLKDSEQSSESFWNRFGEFLKDKNYNEAIINAVSDKDLFDKMKMFHDYGKQGKPFVFDEKDILGSLSKKMEELKSLEKEWDEASKQLESHKIFITEKENAIRNRIDELKDIIASFRRVKQNDLLEAPINSNSETTDRFIVNTPQYYFYLANGQALKSINDLKAALMTMDDSVFYSHVSSDRNDFANWVSGVFKDQELADRFRMAASREQLLLLIDSIS